MKLSRQSKIIELITEHEVENQKELAELLIAAGYPVTQATISRDIRELNLTKVTTGAGKQKYIALHMKEGELPEKYVRILRDGFVSMDTAGNILVVKTVSGMAMAVAAAIDAIHIEGIVGCIAGDDTIMCAVKTQDTKKVMEKISHLLTA